MARISSLGVAAGLFLCVPTSTTAQTSGLSFDCDVPANHFSELSQATALPVEMSGIVLPIDFRSGSYQPVAGARISTADGKKGISLRLVADGSSAKQLTVIFNGMTNSQRPVELGKISRSAPIPFSMKLSETGKVTVTIAGHTTEFDETAIPSVKASVFCSTGQFKFSEVKFSTSN